MLSVQVEAALGSWRVSLSEDYCPTLIRLTLVNLACRVALVTPVLVDFELIS